MKTVEKDVEIEYIEKKSLFIASLKRVNTEEEAKNFIQQKKIQHKSATHNVYSYRLINNNIEYIKYSDDGEPLNTAGKPSYEILNILNIYNVVVVVTRYFGGIKLGAGGLIRAYSKATKLAVDKANIIEYITYETVLVTLKYNDIGIIDNYIQKNNIEILNKGYSDKITYKLKIEIDKLNEMKILFDIIVISL